MNKKIFLSGLSIAVTLALVSGAVFAQLTSSSSANGITFTSETASLLIATDNGSNAPAGQFQSSITAAGPHKVFPGYNQNFAFWLQNASGNDIPLNNVVTLSVGGAPGNLNNNLLLSFNCTDEGIGPTPTPGASLSSNGSFPLSAYGSENIGTLPAGHIAQCIMNASVPSNVTTLSSSDNAVFNATFTGTQVEPSVSPAPSQAPL